MTADEYAADDLARLDVEILTAKRIAEHEEFNWRCAHDRVMRLFALRLEHSIGGSGPWEPGFDRLTLRPYKGGDRDFAWIEARPSLYTGGTQEWTLELHKRPMRKGFIVARGSGATPRQAMRRLLFPGCHEKSCAKAMAWAREVMDNAKAWDLARAASNAELGLLNRESGP